jgi:hypothetical protein
MDVAEEAQRASARLPRAAGGARNDGTGVRPGKNRLVQVARSGKRKLFDAARRAVFLEWLAATCNVVLSAEKAGVCYQTPFKHRMKDAAFEAEWDEAIRQGYARLEARALQEAHSPAVAGGPSTIASPGNGPPPPGELGEDRFNPELALHLLREHKRRLAGSADKRKHQRHAVRVATNAEVIAALEA